MPPEVSGRYCHLGLEATERQIKASYGILLVANGRDARIKQNGRLSEIPLQSRSSVPLSHLRGRRNSASLSQADGYGNVQIS